MAITKLLFAGFTIVTLSTGLLACDDGQTRIGASYQEPITGKSHIQSFPANGGK
jgi:hypothetical protein